MKVYVEVSTDGYYAFMDRGITGEPVDGRYEAMSSNFLGTFNLPSYPKANTTMDAGELLGRERLL